MGPRRRPSRSERLGDAVVDADPFDGLELPAAGVRDALADAGLEPIDVARLLGLSDHWELVIRHILGLSVAPMPPHDTRTHVTHQHALAIAGAIAQVDPGTAARLNATIAHAEEVWLAEAKRQALAQRRAAAAARRGGARNARQKARPRAPRRRAARRPAARPAGGQLERHVPVEVLARLVERVDATPEAIARLTGRRPREVRAMLGLAPGRDRRFRRNATVASARSIAGALGTLARTPYEQRILARELARAQAATGISLVEEIQR